MNYTIRKLTQIFPADLQRLICGYTAQARYAVQREVRADGISIHLTLQPLTQPYLKESYLPDAATQADYLRLPELGFSFGAFNAADECIGLALAEPHFWNRSLWVHELHVDRVYRRQGVARALVMALNAQAFANHLRVLVCETQNTNADAIQFYLRTGFTIEGIDLSYYSNEDFPDGEVAVFMKRRVTE